MPAVFSPPVPTLNSSRFKPASSPCPSRGKKRSAAARIVAHHPRMKGQSLQAVLDTPLAVADAQWCWREYGFDNWAQLKKRVDDGTRSPNSSHIRSLMPPSPRSIRRSREKAANSSHPSPRLFTLAPTSSRRTVISPARRCCITSRATRSWQVHGTRPAGKEHRRDRPSTSRSWCRCECRDARPQRRHHDGAAITEQAGQRCRCRRAADRFARGTWCRAQPEGAGALEDIPLVNHAPCGAEKLIELGAKADVLAAAALGRMELLRGAFDGDGDCGCAAPARNDDERARCDRAGDAVCLCPRATGSRRFSPREGWQLEHDRRQQRHRAASRRWAAILPWSSVSWRRAPT